MTDPVAPTEVETEKEPPVPPLPEAVRARVLALAADAVGRLAPEHLPPALKKVASFAPTRRAKLAGRQIATVLETDDTFREHLGVQVRALVGELGQALMEGTAPPAADPVDAAAAAYLLRSPGWRAVVVTAGETAEAERRAAGAKESDAQVDRWQRRVAELQDEAQRQRDRSKEQLDRLKAENAELRRKLGDTRTRLRDAEATADEERGRREQEIVDAALVLSASESEVRRLRARVSELEGDLGAARRIERASKVEESVRAKLLVDTVVEAAQGLRRELGLPAVERLPADTVAADVAEEGARTSSGRRSLPVDDPALLEELLRLPRAHLVVDGYNVTKTTWPELPLERQRDRLITGVAALLARTGAEMTIVFDAAETRNRPLVAPPRGVRVRFSPYGVIADDVIRDIVAAEPPGRQVVVASSDQAVARDVVSAGFRVVASAALAALLRR
ncbi:MAG TPA: NYN domain-containing protein [Marmoricola sp.]|nr:NYN domain-containing protein [Marmoricola sp.]